MSEKVSVALATFNGERFLLEQLNSFTNQTRRPDELIISDDCSTDNTVNILYEFAASAPFDVKIYVNEKNIGYAQNFSKALELCTGDYIFLSDQDDVWFSDKIYRMLLEFKSKKHIQLLIHDISYCRSDLTEIGQTKIERMSGIFDINKKYIVGMATAVRKNFLSLCLPVPDIINLSHDSWLHQCALAIGKKEIIYDVFSFYRRHSSNATVESKLNVGFFTKSNHFKDDCNFFKKIYKSIRLFLAVREIDKPELTPLTRWLQANRNAIVDHGFCSESHIENLIADDLLRVSSIRWRLNLLTMNRFKRFHSVIIFYLRGNYRFFSGWRSAVKDLLVK